MDLFPRDLIGDHSAINDPLPFLFAQNALRKIDTIHPVEHSQYILYCSLRELQMEHGSGSLEVVAHGYPAELCIRPTPIDAGRQIKDSRFEICTAVETHVHIFLPGSGFRKSRKRKTAALLPATPAATFDLIRSGATHRLKPNKAPWRMPCGCVKQ
jgi:hypothetical protein